MTPHVLMLVENMSAPTDRRVWKEAKSLSAAGYRVSVISPQGPARDAAPHATIDGIEVYRFPVQEGGARSAGYLLEYGQALRHLRRLSAQVDDDNRVDVVHLCNPPDVLFMAIGRLRRRGARVVFDHHDLVPELFEVKFGKAGGVLYRAAQWAERRTFGLAKVVLSPNESYRRIALDRGRKHPDDVFVVRMAPDLDEFRPVTPDPSLRSGKRFLLAYAGTIGPQDGVDHAVRALRLLADRRDDWHAVFAGKGDVVETMRSMTRELGIAERVEFVGFLDSPDLIRLLSSADVCLSPEPSDPLNDASTMIKVVEYMGLGRPIVAYDLKETRFSAGEAALYAPPNDEAAFADRIETLLDDPELSEGMGVAGRRRVEGELSWTRSEEQLLAAYERALAVN